MQYSIVNYKIPLEFSKALPIYSFYMRDIVEKYL